MTPKQQALAKQIFLAVCEQPVGQRSAFLDEACAGDRELHRHISDLLRYHSEVERTVRAAETRIAAGQSPDHGHEVVERDRSRPIESGTIVADRYRIVALLGQGGMGEVYRSDDFVLARPVALKFLTARVSGDAAWRARLLRDVRVAREITHPNVCRLHDIHVDAAAGRAFISMEYIDGEDLRSVLRRVDRLAPGKELAVAREICIGLAAAHAKGILHRDLKPAIIMLDSVGRVRITDFGRAAGLNRRAGNLRGARRARDRPVAEGIRAGRRDGPTRPDDRPEWTAAGFLPAADLPDGPGRHQGARLDRRDAARPPGSPGPGRRRCGEGDGGNSAA